MAHKGLRIVMGWISGNRFLSMDEMKNNAVLIRDKLLQDGWSVSAICGMLGNMQSESFINPGIWEGLNEGNLQGGYGLVQWTPATKYIDWAGTNYQDGYRQLERINFEVDNNLQWIATTEYPLSFADFKVSTDTPYTLAMAFLKNYERPLNPNQPIRGEQANFWYEYLMGVPPEPTPTTKRKMPLYFYLKRRG